MPPGTHHSQSEHHPAQPSSFAEGKHHFQKAKGHPDGCPFVFWRCHPDLNWGWSFCRALPYHLAMAPYGAKLLQKNGASDEARTRYLHLGKVALYQRSYTRIFCLERAMPSQGLCCWCLRSESNQRHEDFQSSALPTELQRQMATRKGPLPHPSDDTQDLVVALLGKMATRKGLEPSTSGVTGRRSNQLNYRARW